MDRAEKVGLGVAAAGHVVLFGLLSVGFLATPNPLKLEEHPVEVSLVPDVAPTQTSPAPAPPAPSVAPEQGPPEEAPPPVEAPAPPEPTPPLPKPKPKPEPAKPVAKPAPAPKPSPAPPKPKPSPPVAEPAPAKPAKPAAKPVATPARPAKPAKPAPAEAGEGEAPAAKPARPRGSRLGPDFLKGLGSDAPVRPARPDAAPGAVMSAKAFADIAAAIKRQVQPCADRQVTPGPGAERIKVKLRLDLNPDGSLTRPPRITNHDGVTDDNRRYLDRVDDLAMATYTGCTPLRGLPPELYGVQNGWRSIPVTYKLPD